MIGSNDWGSNYGTLLSRLVPIEIKRKHEVFSAAFTYRMVNRRANSIGMLDWKCCKKFTQRRNDFLISSILICISVSSILQDYLFCNNVTVSENLVLNHIDIIIRPEATLK